MTIDNIVILGDSTMKHVRRWLEALKTTEKQKQESKSNAFLRSNNNVHGKLHQTNGPTKLSYPAYWH